MILIPRTIVASKFSCCTFSTAHICENQNQHCMLLLNAPNIFSELHKLVILVSVDLLSSYYILTFTKRFQRLNSYARKERRFEKKSSQKSFANNNKIKSLNSIFIFLYLWSFILFDTLFCFFCLLPKILRCLARDKAKKIFYCHKKVSFKKIINEHESCVNWKQKVLEQINDTFSIMNRSFPFLITNHLFSSKHLIIGNT